MKGLFIQDKADKVTISALNYYGADFKFDVYDQDNDVYIYQDLQMTEAVEPVDANSTTVAEDRKKGVESIKVDDASGFAVNDRISLDSGASEIFRITSIDTDTNEIGLHRATKVDVTTSTKVDRSGHLGLYYVELTMSKLGTFLVKAKDAIYGLQRTDAIKVVEAKKVEREFKVMV